MTDTSLEERSALFATSIQSTLDGTLPGCRQVISQKVEGADRYLVTLADAKISLLVEDQALASLSFSLDQQLDYSGQHLKTTGSKITIWSSIDRTPLIRLEYKSNMRSDPICHWQVHAERGARSHLLGIANFSDPKRVKKPHDYSTLHFPVGGERFRPCLEDVLQFLIVDCGVDRLDGWQSHIESGRERWRRMQLRSSVRDAPQDAANTLKSLGWIVQPPENATEDRPAQLRQW